MDLKKELIKTTNVVKKKYLALKRGIANEEEVIKKKFRPIVEPITEIVKNLKEKNKNDSKTLSFTGKKYEDEDEDEMKKSPLFSSADQEEGNKAESISQSVSTDESDTDEDENVSFNDYIEKAIQDVKQEMDHTYGVYLGSKDKWMIGNSKIIYLPHENVIQIKNESFKPTRGLLELMFKKKPIKSLVTEKDYNTYKDILLLTNAHLVKYTEGERIQVTNTFKYKNIIKKLFKKGSGLNTSYMKVDTYPCAPDFVHYDNINKLVDRLKILKASEAAGNTSHNNEIVNIISELREKGVIY